MTGALVVLGWDALDAELVEQYGLADAFGGHIKKIDTYANPVIDEPHTRELWPSLITGLHPDEHGIHAVTDSDGLEWDSTVLNTASTLANGVVPQRVLDAIGRRLRERGAGLDQKAAGYYSANELPTVFDGGGQAISIPNYETPEDRAAGLDATRDGVWGELLVDRDGTAGFEPDISVPAMYDVLGREVGRRVGRTLGTVRAGEPLVWTWFGCLDTVGHMAPAVDAPLEADWYQAAADVTATIRARVPDSATVVCVSDHGLQAGEHTDYATVASEDTDAVTAIDSVFDVAEWVQGGTWRGQRGQAVSADGMRDVKTSLEDLGYV